MSAFRGEIKGDIFEKNITLQFKKEMPKKYDVYRKEDRGKIIYTIYEAGTNEKIGEYDPERFSGEGKIRGFYSHSQFNKIKKDIEFNEKASEIRSSITHGNFTPNHPAVHGGKRKATRRQKQKRSKTRRHRA